MLINLIQQLLELLVADLLRQARDQRLRLLGQLAAQAAELRALELGQLLVRREQPLDRLDVLLALEAREVVEVLERLVQHPAAAGQPRASTSLRPSRVSAGSKAEGVGVVGGGRTRSR